MLTRTYWLDALVGLVLGPASLFAIVITITVISAKLSRPLYDSREGFVNCLIAAGLCATLLWLLGRRFRFIATTAAVGAVAMLLYLLFVVWIGSGMMS